MTSVTADLTPYLPRLLVDWQRECPGASFREVDGSLVFADLSGFTALSERLARRGKEGAEELTSLLDSTFARLLAAAYEQGGSLLKFGGDALLLVFLGPGHPGRACRAAAGMRRELAGMGRLATSAGSVRLRMSIGMHSGLLHLFLAGDLHRELVITGPAASRTVEMESAASGGEILVSPETAALLPPACLGPALGPGRLLKRMPPADAAGLPAVDPLPSAGGELQAFVPPSIRDQVCSGVEDSEHRQATIAFLHFDGTDALVEARGPAALAPLLDETMRSIQAAGTRCEVCFLGSDIDRDGGKIILVAGAPRSAGDDEERMLRALRLVVEGAPALPLRIGVNRGHVFAGAVGPPYRRTYTVMGDAVNLAARLMQRAQPGQILATPEVLDRARASFETNALAPFAVKGKARPVTALVVGPARGQRQATLGQVLPLIGRDEEMEVLVEALASAREGRLAFVDIVGEPGMGKSRLLQELRARTPGFDWRQATAEQYEASTPYFAFRRLLRSLLDVPAEADAAAAGRRLDTAVRSLSPELAPWLPLLADPLEATVSSTPECDLLEPKFRKARLHQAVAALLSKLLPGPTLLVFEDAHWLDEPSLELVRDLVERSGDRPWVICAARRGDPGVPIWPDAPGTRIRLRPLSAEASVALTSAAAGDALISRRELAALATRAGGNPLFLQEVVAVHQPGTEISALPDSVEALLTARIDRLAAADRNLLRYASIVGQTFRLDTLAAAVADLAPAAGEHQSWERMSDFVERQAEREFRFRHALVRDAAYEGLSYQRRRDVHRRVGAEMERQLPGQEDQQAEVLSLHFFRGQHFGKAWRYSVIAGDRAKSKFANVEAAEFYRRAVVAARRVGEIEPAALARVFEGLGDVCELGGHYDEALTAYDDARRAGRRQGLPEVPLVQKSGVVRERQGRYPQALRWYSRALRRLAPGAEGRRQAVGIAVSYAAVRFRQGRYADCVRWCQRVLEDASAEEDRSHLAHAYFLLDHAYTFLGNPESARYRALALPIYEELGDLVGQASVLNNLGVAAYFEGAWDDALAFYRRSREANEKAGDVVGGARAENNVAEILSDQGHLDEAAALLLDVLKAWRVARYPVGVALATSNLGRAATRAGRFEEGQRLLAEALDLFRSLGAAAFVLETQARLAEAFVLADQPRQAIETITPALAGAAALEGTGVLQAMLQRLRGYALAQSGDGDGALAALALSAGLARASGAGFELALALRALAEVREARGEPAGPAREESERLLRRLGIESVPSTPLPPPVPSSPRP